MNRSSAVAALLLAVLVWQAAGFEISTDIGRISGYTALAPKANWLRQRQNNWANEDLRKTLQKQPEKPPQPVATTFGPGNQLVNAPAATAAATTAATIIQIPANAQGQTHYLLQIPGMQAAPQQVAQVQVQAAPAQPGQAPQGFLRYFLVPQPQPQQPQQQPQAIPVAAPAKPETQVQPPLQFVAVAQAPTPQPTPQPIQQPLQQPTAQSSNSVSTLASALVTLRASRMNMLTQWNKCLNEAKAEGKDGLDEAVCQTFLHKSIELSKEIKIINSKMQDLKKQFDVSKILGQIWRNGNH